MARISKYKVPQKRKLTISDAISEAFSTFEELGQEMRDIFDNMPESLQGSDLGQRREEAADTMEQLSEPTIPEGLGEREFEYTYYLSKSSSRNSRRDEATALLSAVRDELDMIINDNTITKAGQDVDAESLHDEVDTLISDAEGADFPGMYG